MSYLRTEAGCRSNLTARVVLPSQTDDAGTDEEHSEDEAFIDEEGDFLEDFPDDTEVWLLISSF